MQGFAFWLPHFAVEGFRGKADKFLKNKSASYSASLSVQGRKAQQSPRTRQNFKEKRKSTEQLKKLDRKDFLGVTRANECLLHWLTVQVFPMVAHKRARWHSRVQVKLRAN